MMGRNGIGKTTLMEALVGARKSRLGGMKIGDAEVITLDGFRRVGKGLAYVPQERQILFSDDGRGQHPRRHAAAEAAGRARERYRRFPGLTEMRRRRRRGNLSGGKQQ